MTVRERSIAEYMKLCPVTMKHHDWRAATDAPGWKLGDECARCERCQIKAIDIVRSHDIESPQR